MGRLAKVFEVPNWNLKNGGSLIISIIQKAKKEIVLIDGYVDVKK